MAEVTVAAWNRVLQVLLRELVAGTAPEAAWTLNAGDPGLLRSLDRLTAADASVVPAGGRSSIAAHVDHLRYGLGLLNRWSRGEDAFSDADYSASWRRLVVSDDEWERLREQLRAEAESWIQALAQPREMTEFELTGVLSSVAHLAYHLGAIRQISPAVRGPLARD